MPDHKARIGPWTIDFYAVDSGRMVGRVAYDGTMLAVDRVHALVAGMAAGEIYARHEKWTDGEVESRMGRQSPDSRTLYVAPPDGAEGFVVELVDDEATAPQAAESGQEEDDGWGIEAQIREWEEDPIGFADTYGYVPTDDLPDDDPRHGMRVFVDGYDDDYNPIEDDFEEAVDVEDPAQPPATAPAVSAGRSNQPRVAPNIGGLYRTNTLIPQEYDRSVGPGVLIEVLANDGSGGSDVRVVETGQQFFCPWGNLLPEVG